MAVPLADDGTVTSTRVDGGVDPPVSTASITFPPPWMSAVQPAGAPDSASPTRSGAGVVTVTSKETAAPGATTTDG